MHLVPVLGWAGGVRRDEDADGGQAAVRVAAVFEDVEAEGPDADGFVGGGGVAFD